MGWGLCFGLDPSEWRTALRESQSLEALDAILCKNTFLQVGASGLVTAMWGLALLALLPVGLAALLVLSPWEEINQTFGKLQGVPIHVESAEFDAHEREFLRHGHQLGSRGTVVPLWPALCTLWQALDTADVPHIRQAARS